MTRKMAASIREKYLARFSAKWPFATKVECEAHKEEGLMRADSEHLRTIFNKYASVTEGDEKFMTYPDFIQRFLQLLDTKDYNEYTLQLFGSSIDTSRDGKISFTEFQAFEHLLSLPDAMYRLSFQIYDRNGSGFLNFKEFEDIVKHTTLHKTIPFNFDCDFIQLHFGVDKSRRISYAEFTQLIHDFNEEHALQAFRKFDHDNNGYINAKDFEEIMISLKSYLLTPFVQENLVSVAVGDFHKKISYAYFTAFISLLNNMELMKKIYMAATKRDVNVACTKEELMYQSQEFPQITPMELDILFQLVQLLHQTQQSTERQMGLVMFQDLEELSPMEGRETPFSLQLQIAEEDLRLETGAERTVLLQIAESVYRFGLGALAGATGATAVYPIDLVKTRLQNQRTGMMVGELMYKNSFDCFKKVVRHEGFRGLYRGLGPQLVGVAPEKAIKLTMNDLMRDRLCNKDGSIALWAEMVSGGIAGASQVMFTNPLEIVKIRLQVAGEIVGKTKVSAIGVVKELGFLGLYKGSRACFLRDIPFSAIYFPAYAHFKKYFADENGYNHPGTLLLAATCAGAPAAALPTPADVIKTRLQVAARQGQTTYNGVIDCARKILREEGFGAFWKGTPARVFRSSPQFGVTLLTYELLQRLFYVDFGGRRPEGSAAKPTHLQDQLSRNPDHIGGFRLALATFDGMERQLGLCLPKFRNAVTEGTT
ncbi:electrogenic aspartate/glutamate antiporter SLC25A13, mitochondrial-like isoform X2 [Mercenaria mercenaria]|uniref:electrogenic aspartate/glutamate antiporter SLC25A13, mitochondrial-like isoform X2 n=1 Tax=Mercenaria mercenaria TaxID=6596 RepID=UPI001E1D3B67|nr:electrogenic aspartate/glutamate antiporter SLC25A13, mitochondrial-like isoform X2 [Mercenaria mercenaria]